MKLGQKLREMDENSKEMKIEEMQHQNVAFPDGERRKTLPLKTCLYVYNAIM